MKNEKGFGSVYKLPGKRRKKYAAVVTTGYVGTIQKRKYIGYFKTKTDAINALSKYNLNPYNLGEAELSFKDLYALFFTVKQKTVSKATLDGYNASYQYFKDIYNKKFLDISTAELQNIIDSNKHLSKSSLNKIIGLFNGLYKYADDAKMPVSKNPANLVKVIDYYKKEEREQIIFTDDEIQRLWENVNIVEGVDIILILIYSGFRINELLKMENKNVNLINLTFKGGNKTRNSINRIVPIHSKIIELVKNRYDKNKPYLINNLSGSRMTSTNFRAHQFENIKKVLKLEDHTIHDTRKTTASLLNRFNATPISIRKILGHAMKDVTEEVYIKLDTEYLRQNLELITI
ncbi:tyrosine-type recombinase/integrase [Helcococcus ovis]|uniref:tyrosine-type recombinase/integrase n=1 Tax=Helcococcus TaxID=31983 RepID=UPI0038BDF746